jgi:hypothetical protein
MVNYNGIAQVVQRLATGWTAEGSEFESRERQDFFPNMSYKPVLGLARPLVESV